MATSKVQRWGIMTILIVTVVGTLGSFAVMILSMQNQQRIQADYEKVNNEYQTQLKAYKAKVQAQADELSAKYYDTFKQYSTQCRHITVFNFRAETLRLLLQLFR